MHVEIMLNGDDSGCPLYEYNYMQYGIGIVPPFNKGDTITLCFRKDEYPEQETGKFIITKVEHFFSKGGYILVAYVDRVAES